MELQNNLNLAHGYYFNMRTTGTGTNVMIRGENLSQDGIVCEGSKWVEAV